ncbi:hypothetical protein NSP_21430 [Nodularia spumigena CCY9414]|nr:hypothetical protein NSP_21430 [Nodularia spumigena CCY9414]
MQKYLKIFNLTKSNLQRRILDNGFRVNLTDFGSDVCVIVQASTIILGKF